MAAKSVGSFLGGILNNPGAVAIALGIGALLVFRKPITEAFASFGENFGKLPDITLPTINFPDFKFPEFPEIKFPDFKFPEFPDVFAGTNDFFEGQQNALTDFVDSITKNLDNVFQPIGTKDITETPAAIGRASDRDRTIAEIIEPIRTILGGSDSLIIPSGDELDLGGGPSFVGGTTTFGSNIIDTFFEALSIFPDLSASELSNLLAENVGLTGSEFALIDPAGEINISSAGEDPIQTLLNSSGGFTGLTPEQISALIT